MIALFFQRYFFSAKAGSLIKKIGYLSLASITLGIIAFILVLSVMTGLHQNIQLRILAIEPHLTISNLQNPVEVEKFLFDQPGSFFRFSSQDVILRTVDGVFKGAIAKGVEPASLLRINERLLALRSGQEFEELPLPGENEAILGSTLAHALGVFEGDTLNVIAPETLLMPVGQAGPVAQIKVKKIFSSNLEDIDNQLMFYTLGESLKQFQKSVGRTEGFEMFFNDVRQSFSIKEKVLVAFSGVKVETFRDRNSSLFFALQLEKSILGVFLGMGAVLTGLSVMSVLALLISQKQKEIGIMMALGMSRARLMKLFSGMGVLLAGSGIVLGALLGGGISFYLEQYPLNVLPDIYYDALIPAKFDLWFVVLTMLIAMAMAYATCRSAVKKILQMNPSESIRGIQK